MMHGAHAILVGERARRPSSLRSDCRNDLEADTHSPRIAGGEEAEEVAPVGLSGAWLLGLLIWQEKSRRLGFRGVSALEVALVIVGRGRAPRAEDRVVAPVGEAYGLLTPILIVNIVLIGAAARGSD